MSTFLHAPGAGDAVDEIHVAGGAKTNRNPLLAELLLPPRTVE